MNVWEIVQLSLFAIFTFLVLFFISPTFLCVSSLFNLILFRLDRMLDLSHSYFFCCCCCCRCHCCCRIWNILTKFKCISKLSYLNWWLAGCYTNSERATFVWIRTMWIYVLCGGFSIKMHRLRRSVSSDVFIFFLQNVVSDHQNKLSTKGRWMLNDIITIQSITLIWCLITVWTLQ